MQQFARLYRALDATTSTSAMIASMADYFRTAEPANAAWAVFLLKGERLRSPVKRGSLREWAREAAGLDEWLFDETYSAVGDLAETIALVLDTAGVARTDTVDDEGGAQVAPGEAPLHVWMEHRLPALGKLGPEGQQLQLLEWWQALDMHEIFVLGKLMTGALRVGVSRRLVVRALAEASGVERTVVAHRLMGHFEPSAEAFARLVDESASTDTDVSRPYPYFLASPIDEEADPSDVLGDRDDWQAEWKYDGIRGQLIRRDGEVYLWSRGEDLVNVQFPEVVEMALEAVPDGVVLDGELLAMRDGEPLSFGELQRRLGRKKVGKKLRSEVPVVFVAWDCLEHGGADLRAQPLEARRARVEAVVEAADHAHLRASPCVSGDSWAALAAARQESRSRGVEGLMLKRVGSPYRVGRVRGDWWKWKVEPYTIDAVLIYAQPGSGRRANLLTDYTFGVWADDGETLVPIAKAYSGLSNAEIRQVDHWIRRHTVERFGPVRSVEPTHVFELSFEGVRESTRHKSGLAVRFPRIARWRTDKTIAEANTLADVRDLAGLVPTGSSEPDEPS